MSRTITKWKLYHIITMIVATLLNKYDFFIVIEGNTGTGKSTLAFHIAKGVSLEFKRLYKLNEERVEYYYERVGRRLGLTAEQFVEKILDLKKQNAYTFVPRASLIYSQKELQKKLASWHSISIPDEMINITFNRDFYSEKQKDIIKMLNMFRDHENLTLACVPLFQNLDTQIKNLCKMKLTVKKRGVAIIHTPNNTVYCKDKWDQATNEKIERQWIARKILKPNYSKLTTFRGLLRFPPLNPRHEAMYQQIKNDKRSLVLKDDMNVTVVEDQDDPYHKFLQRLLDGGIKNSGVIEGFALSLGIDGKSLQNRIRKDLHRMGKNPLIRAYYYEKKAKGEAEEGELLIPQASFEGV